MHAEETAEDFPCGRKIALPPFYISDPQIWFLEVENIFSYHGIIEELHRFNHVIQHLPSDVAEVVNDLLFSVPKQRPYTKLKTAILDGLDDSKVKHLRKRFINVKLGSKKSSQSLRVMRNLTAAADNIDSVILRQIWLEKLPTSMRHILASYEEPTTLDKKGAFADTQEFEKSNDKPIEELERRLSSLSVIHSRRSRSRSLSLHRKKRCCFPRKSFSPEGKRSFQRFFC